MSTLMRAALVVFPSWFTLTLLKVLGALSGGIFRTSADAALSDVFEGKELAIASAQVKMWTGMALVVAPALGGRLAERNLLLPFVASAAVNILNHVQLSTTLPETATLDPTRAKRLSWSDVLVNPLNVVKLFT